MRDINQIFIHCSATKATSNVTVADITRWHKERGFRTIGYHHVIYRDGSTHPGRPENEIGAHVTDKNSRSIGVCLVGGIDAKGKEEDNFTPEQWVSLKRLVIELKKRYPKAEVLGHRDAPAAKACPCFDVRSWCRKEGISL